MAGDTKFKLGLQIGVMMTDPLGELEDSLAYMFELQKARTTGNYISPLVQNLKKALDNYKSDRSLSLGARQPNLANIKIRTSHQQPLIRPSGTFSPFRGRRENEEGSLGALIVAIKNALPVIENYVDSYTVKQKVEVLAGEAIRWHSRPARPRFQFAAADPSAKSDFISWLSLRAGKDFTALDSEAQAKILIAERAESEFTTKLGEHLRSNPDFLTNLAMASPRIFIKLMNSRLGFQLEKQQIAKVIHQHGLTMIDDTLDPIEQVDKLVSFLDRKLSATGHSVKKLLSDPLAKAELDKLELFQLYQSPEYRTRQDHETNQVKP